MQGCAKKLAGAQPEQLTWTGSRDISQHRTSCPVYTQREDHCSGTGWAWGSRWGAAVLCNTCPSLSFCYLPFPYGYYYFILLSFSYLTVLITSHGFYFFWFSSPSLPGCVCMVLSCWLGSCHATKSRFKSELKFLCTLKVSVAISLNPELSLTEPSLSSARLIWS